MHVVLPQCMTFNAQLVQFKNSQLMFVKKKIFNEPIVFRKISILLFKQQEHNKKSFIFNRTIIFGPFLLFLGIVSVLQLLLFSLS